MPHKAVFMMFKNISFSFVLCLFISACSTPQPEQKTSVLEQKVAYMELEPVTKMAFVEEDQQQGAELVYIQAAQDLEQIMPAAGENLPDDESKNIKN